jgi:hypothetical protein
MMSETTQFMEERALLAGAAFMLTFALLVGGVLYALLTSRRWRRESFRSLRVWPRPLGAAAGLALAAVVCAAFRATSIRGFREIVRRDDAVVLTWSLPDEVVTIARGDVADALLEPGTGGRSRLVVTTRQGDEYASVPAPTELVARVQERLRSGR